MSRPSFGSLVQAFFSEHLREHRGASPHTIDAYRDAFRLLLRYLQETGGIAPASAGIADLDAPLIIRFLDHLEHTRSSTVRSRNARLAAIRSFFRYVALKDPESVGVATRVLAIPVKRADRRLVGYLTRSEMEALLDAPDRTKRSGRRDHALLATMYNTGARLSEVTGLHRDSVRFAPSPFVHLQGKGRKEREVPLWARTARILGAWLQEIESSPGAVVFPNARGGRLSADGVSYVLGRALKTASAQCPTLAAKRITPHVLRHTTAMHLLQSGVDISVIGLWLGHESLETTHIYVEADLVTKQSALTRLTPAGAAPGRFRANDALLAFLSSF